MSFSVSSLGHTLILSYNEICRLDWIKLDFVSNILSFISFINVIFIMGLFVRSKEMNY